MGFVQHCPDHSVFGRDYLQVCLIGMLCLGHIHDFPDQIHIRTPDHSRFIGEPVVRGINLRIDAACNPLTAELIALDILTSCFALEKTYSPIIFTYLTLQFIIFSIIIYYSITFSVFK